MEEKNNYCGQMPCIFGAVGYGSGRAVRIRLVLFSAGEVEMKRLKAAHILWFCD